MEYFTLRRRFDGYSYKDKLKYHRDYKAFIRRVSELVLRAGDSKPVGLISTRVAANSIINKLFTRSKYIAFIDCDLTECMLAACRSLKVNNIGYAVIQSSPNHYWIITDIVDNIKNIVSLLRSTPGVDSDWIDVVEARGRSLIRAVSFPDRVPCFPDSHSLTNPHSIKLLNELQTHFDKPEIKTIHYNLVLAANVKNGGILNMACDPKFEL